MTIASSAFLLAALVLCCCGSPVEPNNHSENDGAVDGSAEDVWSLIDGLEEGTEHAIDAADYPGTSLERLTAAHKRVQHMDGNTDWPRVRRSLLHACGLWDRTDVAPGLGYTGHCFNDCKLETDVAEHPVSTML